MAFLLQGSEIARLDDLPNALEATDLLVAVREGIAYRIDLTDINTYFGGVYLQVANNLDDVNNAGTARVNLGLEIDVDVQAYSVALESIAGLTTSADQLIYTTASNVYATSSLTGFGRSLLDDIDAAAARETMGVEIGVDVQAYSADLAAIAGLTSAANKVPYFTGSETAGLLDFLDQDDMSSDSATAIPSQQSVKAYIDGRTDTTVNAIGSIGGGTQDIDLDDGRTITATVDTSTTTFTFSNPLATGNADAFDIYLTNGGSQTINWPASVDWVGGNAPTLTASGLDHLVFTTVDGGTTWYGYVVGLDVS